MHTPTGTMTRFGRLLISVVIAVTLAVSSLSMSSAAEAKTRGMKPTGVHVVATAAGFKASWHGPAGHKVFRVKYSRSKSMKRAVHYRTVRGHHLTVHGLKPGRRYYVRVKTLSTRRRSLSHYTRRHSIRTRPSRTDGQPSEPTQPTDPTPPTPPSDPTPPTPPPSQGPDKTLFGVNYGDDPNVDESLYQGRAQVARIYLQGLGNTKWNNIDRVQRATKAGIKTFVVSWKDEDVDHVKAFLASIPDGLTIYACFNHEPENDHGNPGDASYAAWSAEWKKEWTIQSPLIRAEGFIPTQILMGWTLYPGSKRKIEDWTAPKGTVDVFGFDGYVNNFDPTDLVNRMVAATKAAGLTQTGIAETGSQISDNARTSKLTKLRSAMESTHMFDWGIYWNDVDPGFDCRLNEKDADVWLGDQ